MDNQQLTSSVYLLMESIRKSLSSLYMYLRVKRDDAKLVVITMEELSKRLHLNKNKVIELHNLLDQLGFIRKYSKRAWLVEDIEKTEMFALIERMANGEVRYSNEYRKKTDLEVRYSNEYRNEEKTAIEKHKEYSFEYRNHRNSTQTRPILDAGGGGRSQTIYSLLSENSNIYDCLLSLLSDTNCSVSFETEGIFDSEQPSAVIIVNEVKINMPYESIKYVYNSWNEAVEKYTTRRKTPIPGDLRTGGALSPLPKAIDSWITSFSSEEEWRDIWDNYIIDRFKNNHFLQYGKVDGIWECSLGWLFKRQQDPKTKEFLESFNIEIVLSGVFDKSENRIPVNTTPEQQAKHFASSPNTIIINVD